MPGNIPHPSPLDIAKWPKPNYDDPQRRIWLPAFAITLHILATIPMFLRLGSRLAKHGGGIGLDDALFAPSWLFAMGFVALAATAADMGIIDRHIWDVRPEKFVEYALNAWLGELFFVSGTACLKISVLLFYRRLVQNAVVKKWKYAIWIAIFFTATFSAFLILMLIFNCSPTKAYWNLFDPRWPAAHPGAHCIDTMWINPTAGALSMVSDLYAVGLPCVMLRSLWITKRQRIHLYSIFALGLVVVAAGCGRTYAFTKLTHGSDVTWDGFMVYFWSVLEFELGIMCACAPAIRSFFKQYLEGRHGRKVSSTTASIGLSSSSPLPLRYREVEKEKRSDGTASARCGYDTEEQHLRSEKPPFEVHHEDRASPERPARALQQASSCPVMPSFLDAHDGVITRVVPSTWRRQTRSQVTDKPLDLSAYLQERGRDPAGLDGVQT